MKRSRICPCAFLLSILLVLSACHAEAPAEDGSFPPSDLAAAILDSQTSLPDLSQLTPGEDGFSAYLESYYQLSAEDVESGVICCAGGAEAVEITVLSFRDPDTAVQVQEALSAYLDRRAADFTGYLPEQAALVEQGKVTVHGRYAALLICPEPEAAETAFLSCFDAAPSPAPEETSGSNPEAPQNTRPPEPEPTEPLLSAGPSAGPRSEPDAPQPETPTSSSAPEPKEDIYDAAAVLLAWQTGDASSLSGKNQAILDACRTVIGGVISEGMSEYERELAIHDWMLAWGSYDSNSLSHLPDYQTHPDNDNPYGFLIAGKGICSGYASTFQLFMDLLDIECVTVAGTSHGGTADHAWNMVRLDGEWYCVDVTWDDPSTAYEVSPEAAHQYFNRTSDDFRLWDHQWDETAVEAANGTKYAWNPA